MEENIRSGFSDRRVVHLHPSSFCNLFCKHCYSSSGPNIKNHLDVKLLIKTLKIMWSEGYTVLSLSGGEPLLYNNIEMLLKEAKKIGFKINIITNGAPVNEKNIGLVKDYINLTAVSLDGPPELHNYMRNNKNAFYFAEKAIDKLNAHNLKSGIAYGVSSKSLKDMPWAIQFAENKNCSIIHFHPFAAIGRGALMPYLELNKFERTKAYTIANLFSIYNDLSVTIDLVASSNALEQVNDYHILQIDSAAHYKLSDIINPIIISEKGNLLPYCFGIDEYYSLSNIGNDVEADFQRWKESKWKHVKSFVQNAFDSFKVDEEDYVDWFLHLLESSFKLVKRKV